MYSTRFGTLMTEGYALANKIYFKEFDEYEFETWLDACRRLLSCCDPEPPFPWFPDHRHIEEIVVLLSKTSSRISKGEIANIGIF